MIEFPTQALSCNAILTISKGVGLPWCFPLFLKGCMYFLEASQESNDIYQKRFLNQIFFCKVTIIFSRDLVNKYQIQET